MVQTFPTSDIQGDMPEGVKVLADMSVRLGIGELYEAFNKAHSPSDFILCIVARVLTRAPEVGDVSGQEPDSSSE